MPDKVETHRGLRGTTRTDEAHQSPGAQL